MSYDESIAPSNNFASYDLSVDRSKLKGISLLTQSSILKNTGGFALDILSCSTSKSYYRLALFYATSSITHWMYNQPDGRQKGRYPVCGGILEQ